MTSPFPGADASTVRVGPPQDEAYTDVSNLVTSSCICTVVYNNMATLGARGSYVEQD